MRSASKRRSVSEAIGEEIHTRRRSRGTLTTNHKTTDETDDSSKRDSPCRLPERNSADENDGFKSLTKHGDEWEDEERPFTTLGLLALLVGKLLVGLAIESSFELDLPL